MTNSSTVLFGAYLDWNATNWRCERKTSLGKTRARKIGTENRREKIDGWVYFACCRNTKKNSRKHNQRAPEDVADWEKKRLQSKQTVTTIHSHYNVDTTKSKLKSTEKLTKPQVGTNYLKQGKLIQLGMSPASAPASCEV